MNSSHLMLIRKRCLFKGEVQGVGFRFFVSYQAKEFHLTGFVENLLDGSVKVEAQGEEETVNQFIERILDSNFKIEGLVVSEIPVEQEKAFYTDYE